MSTDVYDRLREFMDTLPAGYPKTPTGVEIRILKKLFSPEEAELVMKLRNEPEEVSVIAARIGADEPELAPKLEEMAQKGIIFRVRKGDTPLYQAHQFLIGLYEFQLKELDKEFCEMFEEYFPFLGGSFKSLKTPQMRIIPVDRAIDTALPVATYDRARELVEQQDLLTVAECICRKEQKLLGKECDRPKETCLLFGDFGRYYLDNGMSREISKEEAFKILDMAEESALVLRPSNDQKVEAICCCCPCCCLSLRYNKIAKRPAKHVLSHYYAKIDPDLCSACGACVERCQIDAIKEGEEFSEILEDRCIGCGLCVPTCPEEAITMVAKPDIEAPPVDFREMLNRIETERRVL